MADPAAIRFNNPGAMWGKGNPIAKKWGASSTTFLNDGLGQGNNIAYFPTKFQGACAQFDLWRSGYCNRTLRAAITRWSGGNWSDPYANFLVRNSGISLDEEVTPVLLASDRGWRLMKAQAQWEAGKPYPLSDSDWMSAQKKVFGGSNTSTGAKKTKAAGAVVVATTATATATAAGGGNHWGILVGILFVGFVAAVGLYIYLHGKHEAEVTPPTPRPIGPGPEIAG